MAQPCGRRRLHQYSFASFLHPRSPQILHPKDEPHHGHGLTLENHTEEKDHTYGAYEYGGAESNQNYRAVEPAGLSAPAQYQERLANTGPATFE